MILLSYFQNKKMADPIWRLKYEKRLSFFRNSSTGVSEVADQNVDIGLSKFQMANTIWQFSVREKLKLCSKLVYRGFRSW